MCCDYFTNSGTTKPQHNHTRAKASEAWMLRKPSIPPPVKYTFRSF